MSGGHPLGIYGPVLAVWAPGTPAEDQRLLWLLYLATLRMLARCDL